MIWVLVLFLCGIIWQGFSILAKYIEEQRQERQRFCLLVAQELDRLDKAIKENEELKQNQEIVTPYKDLWDLRN